MANGLINETDDQPIVVKLSGEYDLARRVELEGQLSVAYAANVAVIDMSDVSYIDSTALACFIRLKKRMSAHGPGVVRILRPQTQVRRVLELTQLDQIFELDNQS
jgi:anti-sigma B factor antagonist